MQKAIVIGASSGVGRELAITLAKNGYEVGLMARRVGMLEDLQQDISTKTYIGHIDITQTADAREKLQNMIQKMEKVDLIVINAGVLCFNPELDWPKEQHTLDVNVHGFCALAVLAFNYFSKQGHGHLVGTSSIAADRGYYRAPAYHASKAFMKNYLEGLRMKAYKEHKPIIVTEIKLGFVDTDMVKMNDQKFWVVAPQIAAKQIYSSVQQRKESIYIPKRWIPIGWIMKLLPYWLYRRF